MTAFRPGLVHAPLTPFGRERAVDLDAFARIIDFHLRHGAQALALPMHVGESVSLTEEEKERLLAFAIAQSGDRVPVLAHVSNAGTAIAADLARRAQALGAAAIIASAPYYWTPPGPMLVEHLAQIGGAVRIPFFVHNVPDEMAGSKVGADLVSRLIDRLDNFAGLVDSGLDWQLMIELMTEAPRKRSAFQLIAGTEHLVSAGAIGATGMISSLAAVAPNLVRSMYELVRRDQLIEARKPQEDLAALRQALKPGGASMLKAAVHALGRPCGAARPPLHWPDAEAYDRIARFVTTLPALRAETRGW